MIRLKPLVFVLSLIAITSPSPLLVARADSSTQTFYQAIDSRTTSVSLQNVAGNITIEGWDKPGVQVNAVKQAQKDDDLSKVHIDVHRDGTNITITTRYDRSMFGTTAGTVFYSIRVPRGSSVSAKTEQGDITADGLGGSVMLNNQAGNITASLVKCQGNQTVALTSTAGRIALTVPKDSSATVHAASAVGNFKSNFSIAANHGVVGVTANGKIGAGSAKVDLTTTSGSITLNGK